MIYLIIIFSNYLWKLINFFISNFWQVQTATFVLYSAVLSLKRQTVWVVFRNFSRVFFEFVCDVWDVAPRLNRQKPPVSSTSCTDENGKTLSKMNRATFLLVLVTCASGLVFAEKSTKRNGAERRKSEEQMPSCSSCKHHKELKKKNLEMIQATILMKMGFETAPNVTGKTLPQLPAHILNLVSSYEMQSDEPVYKTGPSFSEEDDNFHPTMEKIITFAQPCKYRWNFTIAYNFITHSISFLYCFVFWR